MHLAVLDVPCVFALHGAADLLWRKKRVLPRPRRYATRAGHGIHRLALCDSNSVPPLFSLGQKATQHSQQRPPAPTRAQEENSTAATNGGSGRRSRYALGGCEGRRPRSCRGSACWGESQHRTEAEVHEESLSLSIPHTFCCLSYARVPRPSHCPLTQDDDHPPLGCPIDVRDDDGMTPLHWLTVEGHSGIVQWLVEEVEAEVDQRDDKFGQTSLHFAASKDHGPTAQQLIDLRADPQARDKAGWTPLHTAARAGSAHVATVLLASLPTDAVDATGPGGQTPLMRAAFWGHTEIVVLLLNAGAKRGKTDARGRMAEDLVCDGGERHGELPALLKLLRSPKPAADAA